MKTPRRSRTRSHALDRHPFAGLVGLPALIIGLAAIVVWLLMLR